MSSGFISGQSPAILEYEQAWAKYCCRKYGVAVCNGTAALELAMHAVARFSPLRLDNLGEVIIPSFTIISCAEAIIDAGLKPVLVDSDRVTWTMRVEQIEDKITQNTVAIMPVHIYGQMANMASIRELANFYHLYVVEDASEAHGASLGRYRAGQAGDLAVFSTYANKIVNTGEGGIVLTDNRNLLDYMESFRNLAHSPERRFMHNDWGRNYRMTGLQAALGASQVAHIEKTIEMKRKIAEVYYEVLGECPNIILPPKCNNYMPNWNVYWMFGVVMVGYFGKVTNLDYVINKLDEKGIETRPFFVGMHRQPVLRKMGLFWGEDYPVADWLTDNGFYLPSGPNTPLEDIRYAAETLKEILE